jgi:hypothetical protein
MRIRRAILIPAILALGAVGPVVAGAAMPAAAASVASAHGAMATPSIYYYG